MPTRPLSAGKKGGKKDAGKKGKKKSAKTNAIDPHQEQIDNLVREREEIRSKLNIVCSKIMENINMDDYQNEIDLTKQQPSDVSIDHLLTMIDQICFYRVAFLNLFQEVDDSEHVPVQRKITQLAVDEPDMFRKRLTADQRLTFVTRERDLWKENAQFLQIMYATIVDQLDMDIFKKPNAKTDEILQTHRHNLDDVSLIFSAPTIRSINDAQKLRAKKNLDTVLNDLRDQHAFFDIEQTQKQDIADNSDLSTGEYPLKSQLSSSRSSTSEKRAHPSSSSVRRSVSFADEVNILNDYDETDLPQQQQLPPLSQQQQQQQQGFDDDLSTSPFVHSSSFIVSSQEINEEKYADSDYYSLSSSSPVHHQPIIQYEHSQQQQQPIKSVLPSKYRLPFANEILVNKMDSNLRMLIIKELSKSGHTERPLSRMSKLSNQNSNSRVHSARFSPSTQSPEWVELARLIGIDEDEIDHWLSQNLQYPAGRVISAWCNYASPPPTVAELHSLLSSKELNRSDLGRYIETMYTIDQQ